MIGRPRSLRCGAALPAAIGLTAAAPAAATPPAADPERIRPALDSGDHLHPNDAGAAALAVAVPPRLFR
jgi:lysophospholipase L1-like esterase